MSEDKAVFSDSIHPANGVDKNSEFDLNSITEGKVTSVADLIDLADAYDPSLPSRWAFRGQPRDFGTLVPSFQRQFSRRSLGAAETIERRLIKEFRAHYAELPDLTSDMPRPERIDQRYDLRCLSVMQHYEIPTRLLDWTANFWTAVYFACASDPGTTAELWCYDRYIFELQRRSFPDYLSLVDTSSAPFPEPNFLNKRGDTIVELDPRISPRMTQQQAHHTVSNDAFGDHAPLIFALRQRSEPSIEFRRFLIDGSCKSKALQYLQEERSITASTIFPDVVGLGRFLRWQFESLRTMLL